MSAYDKHKPPNSIKFPDSEKMNLSSKATFATISMKTMQSTKDLEKILKVLANRRRLAIIQHLKKNKEAKVGDIADKIKLSFKATSKHLALLFNADIVEKEQRSLQMWYKLSASQSHISKYISNSLE